MINRRTFLRFGRIILVTLAPLLGLSAISGAIATGPVASNVHKSLSLTRLLLLSVVTPMADSSVLSDRAQRPSPQAVLPFSAMADTPFRHSVWMVASQNLVPFSPPSQKRSQLRC
jgi:hypothetical protein